ncbi:arrestin-related trafficking adapter 4/5/7 [Geosmithia morbida]|uniref:Arrestin-related trafficking adapter 4/5/7 n=1 Tax=Geosmithia morbida TaxID=1094350 RepID=A0A9P4Z0W4_9HYPO|nr:arrestin-related trafficking adapter 4/5/7 [Geosmithia morbida]KAF4125650.1 arrestin-related trafficking adapter 4/5/7 [Geosmithia morbida]
MPSFKPFHSVTGRNAASLFDIRLENDFIVFRGGEHESAGQLIKGVIVLCLPSPLKIEDIHLRLTGTLRIKYVPQLSFAPPHDKLVTGTPGSSSQKVDRLVTILEHRWEPFVGTPGKSLTLPAGNYEYPFEYTMPGDAAESVEGISEASISYRLKATVGRGKFAYDLHSYKHLRVIRTLEAGALEFHHAMSVENIWPNKIDYSIVVPQKAVAFGGRVNLEMRLTPLLKGLELGKITVCLMEIRETCIQSFTGYSMREHKVEREVERWDVDPDRDNTWQDTIEDTGQEGWVIARPLNLPRRLRQCIQDVNIHGIKVRHKLKLTIGLKNPDGHISEVRSFPSPLPLLKKNPHLLSLLSRANTYSTCRKKTQLRATLPVSIFISPNVPLDEQGSVINPQSARTADDPNRVAPPSYSDHQLDQLYDDDMTGFQTPAGGVSGVSSPIYLHSRAGSSENLAGLHGGHRGPVAPADLSSRLANVSDDPTERNTAFNQTIGSSVLPAISEPSSSNLTRHNSGNDTTSSGQESPQEHVDELELAPTTRVPSYSTAVRTRAPGDVSHLPDYRTAMSTPSTPPATDLGLVENGDVFVASVHVSEDGSSVTTSGSTTPGNLSRRPTLSSRPSALRTSRPADEEGPPRRVHIQDQAV